MTSEERLHDMAKKVLSGKDEWIYFVIDGYNVATTAVFVKKYANFLENWVREFLAMRPTVGESGKKKEFQGEIIYQLMVKDPNGKPAVCIETWKRLLEKEIIKPCVRDGQNKTHIGF